MVMYREVPKTTAEAIFKVLLDEGEQYGMPLRQKVSVLLGRDLAIGEIYATCDVMEAAHVVSSRLGDPTPERGRRHKKYWKILQ